MLRVGLLAVGGLALLPAWASATVVMDWVAIGDPGNAPDGSTCYPAPTDCAGSVAEPYLISKYEISNTQYSEFLNAVANADPGGLYNVSMESNARGGILRSGSPGSYTYAVKAGHGDRPVVFVSFYDALRFANWLHNGSPVGPQGPATTEDGAYTISPEGIAENSIVRNTGALFSLPTHNEWYKAAYFEPGLQIYWSYPMGSNMLPTCEPPPGVSNSANCFGGSYALTGSASFDDTFNYLTDVGAYLNARSPYGTYDQGGSVGEWVEDRSLPPSSQRRITGGHWDSEPIFNSSAATGNAFPESEDDRLGFRLAHAVPEPQTNSLVIAAMMCLAALGKISAYRVR